MNLEAEIARAKSALLRKTATDELLVYTRAMWNVIEPATPFVDGWHLHAIADHLEAVTKFEIPKLIINVPPRHTKSILVSVMWPSWVWLREAYRRFIFSSYAQSLSTRDSVKMRTLIKSNQYNSLFKPKWSLKDDQDQKMRFENTETGFRFSTSVGGTITGEGGDYLIADDPLNAQEAGSELKREAVNDWWDHTMSSRANNPNKVARVIIMQRLHENDLTGYLEAKRSGYEVLRLPAQYDPKIISTPGLNFLDKRTEEGELLWPERFNEERIKELKIDLGSAAAHAQLQQDPKPADGGKFKRHWWKFYKEKPKFHRIVQFWDCAQKDGIENDYSVCATWGEANAGYYLLDIWRDKVQSPQLMRAIQTNFDKHPGVVAIVVEDKSAGSAVIQHLLQETTLPIIPFEPEGDKIVRADAATPTVEAGKCYLPEGEVFVEDFISEHEKFPLATHDDQVDTTSMMRKYFVGLGSQPRIRSL